MRVLLVDDLVESVEMLSLLISSLGHEVATAYDGQEAVAVAERFEPHVAFVDLDMPVRSGYEAATAIRALGLRARPVLIAFTGLAGEDVQAKTVSAGFDLYLQKPASANILMALLEKFARGLE